VIGRLHNLRRDARGVSAIEFGLVAPILAGVILATFQFGLDMWAKAVLDGAMQAAGRSSGIEDYQKSQAALDKHVTDQVQALLPMAKVTFSRKNYQNFSDVGTPEDFTDSNHNNIYDDKECFEDENGNGQWDADSGKTGQGGARDVVVYSATMEYKELVPVRAFFGLGDQRKSIASTTLMNQPFSTQADRTVKEICP
jgi:Flp pilus assembly protein TadG